MAWTATADGVIVAVRLTPRGGRDAIEGIERRADGTVVLKARVRAAPFEARPIWRYAGCSPVRSAWLSVEVELVAGATARIKRVRIAGEPAAIVAALARVTAERGG